jgi:hypothetical protein
MSRRRSPARHARGWLCLVLVGLAVSVPLPQAWADGGFLVPTHPSVTGFGKFREGLRPKQPDALKHLYGAPSARHKTPGEYFSTCTLVWREIGLAAVFSDYPYGPEVNACTEGYFVRARLTDARWHTPGGIGPGDGEDAARRQARGRCSRPFCGARRNVILGFHRSACGPELFTGVVAIFKRGKVSSLVVRSHICD